MSDMARFGPVGKNALKNAIGLQKNRKEIQYVEVQMLDESASGCFSCKNYSLKKAFGSNLDHPVYLTACAACSSCPNKEYHTSLQEKITYINEKNVYGDKTKYSATLKSNALKLFLALHLLHPNRYGVIINSKIDELSSILGCDRKTIISNLDILKNYNYIDYIRIPRKGIVNICILGYESYFLPAKLGGRGYMTFSDDLVKELIKLNNITSLRLYLQELLDFDNYNGVEKKSFTKSYQQLKCFLPDYYKPNHIRKGLSMNMESPIFKVTINDSITFQLNSAYNAKKMKEEVIKAGQLRFADYIEHLNVSFSLINDGKMLPESLLQESYYNKYKPAYYVPYIISEKDLKDLGTLSWQYSDFDIIDGIDYIYQNYILHDKPIETYGGLLRTIIEEQINIRLYSSNEHQISILGDESNFNSAAA